MFRKITTIHRVLFYNILLLTLTVMLLGRFNVTFPKFDLNISTAYSELRPRYVSFKSTTFFFFAGHKQNLL